MNIQEGFRRLRKAAQISLGTGAVLVAVCVAIRIWSEFYPARIELLGLGIFWALGVYLVFFGALGWVAAWIGTGFIAHHPPHPPQS
jgi:hypothetical protein